MKRPPAFVLLEKAALPRADVLVETLRRRHPNQRWEKMTSLDRQRDDHLAFRAGDYLMVVMMLPAPLPYNQPLWERTSWVWPEAFHAVRRHRAHLIVSTLGPADDDKKLKDLSESEAVHTTTAVVGGIIAAQPGCLGVLWDGQVGRSAEMWLEQSLRAYDPYPDHPFALWTEIVHFVHGKSIGAYTLGLSAFVGREIELEVDGLDQQGVTTRAANVLSYMVAHGLDERFASEEVYADGDAKIGGVAVLHRESRFGFGPVVSFFSPVDRVGRDKTYPIIPASIASNHPLLALLSQVGLFDPAKPENLIKLKPDHYVSEARLEDFDGAISSALSNMLATEAHAEAVMNARGALARGDMESAKQLLQPLAEDVTLLQNALELALIRRDVWMFELAPPRSP